MYDLQKEFGFCKKYMRDAGVKIADDDKLIASEHEFGDGTLGYCFYSQADGKFIIHIKSALLDGRVPVNILRGIIMHELLHTRERCMSHGKTFMKIAMQIKELSEGKYNILACISKDYFSSPEKKISAVYECDVCGDMTYVTEGDPLIGIIEGQKAGVYRCPCPICRTPLKPSNKRNASF